MKIPKSLTATIHLPDARMDIHLSFDGNEGAVLTGDEAKKIGRILNSALDLSPELQELVIGFADYVRRTTENKGRQSPH